MTQLSRIARRIAAPLDEIYDSSEGLASQVQIDPDSDIAKDFENLFSKFDIGVRVFLLPADLTDHISKYKRALEPYRSSTSVNLLLPGETPGLDFTAGWQAHDIFHKVFDILATETDKISGRLYSKTSSVFDTLVGKFMSGLSKDTDNLLNNPDSWSFLMGDPELLKILPGYNTNKEFFDTLWDIGVIFFKYNGDPSLVPDLRYNNNMYLIDEPGIRKHLSPKPTSKSTQPYALSDESLPNANAAFKDLISYAFTTLRQLMESKKGKWMYIGNSYSVDSNI
jgi:hypothetical protein